ncbi:MAG TPA: hypothetical protein VJA83_03940 [Sulfuricurvum sp.]|nr:hypothetical protein [Sulfuricurvum sp.]
MSIIEQYIEKKSLFEKLSSKAKAILTEALEEEKIEFLSITGRVKEKDSLAKKIDKKSYSDISDITDVIGLRVITYVESEIPKIEKIIHDCFSIHLDDSMDKGKSLKTNEFGYRSVHFVCDLGDDRKSQPEYKKICGIPFEIQVRTVLQHGWAEIEHDRNYKFSGELPDQFKRRFYILAGTLELIDREFDSLSQDIAKYAEEEKIKISHNELDIEINTITIDEYLLKKFANFDFIMNTPKEVIQEIHSFGLTSIKEFDEIINYNFDLIAEKNPNEDRTSTGLIRHALMIYDLKRYFQNFNHSWGAMDREDRIYEFLLEKYPNLDLILEKNGIEID